MQVNLNDLLQQAQELQSKMQLAQEALAKVVVTGSAGGGLLKIDIDGKPVAKSVWLSPTLLQEHSGNKEFIEELILLAINDALDKVGKASREKLASLTSQFHPAFGGQVVPPAGT